MLDWYTPGGLRKCCTAGSVCGRKNCPDEKGAGSKRGRMSEYRRPTFPAETYRDECGAPINYGNRWDGAAPPEDAYSRLGNVQRFAPLHAVAFALVEWLQSTFDATVEETLTAARDLSRGRGLFRAS